MSLKQVVVAYLARKTDALVGAPARSTNRSTSLSLPTLAALSSSLKLHETCDHRVW